MPTPPPPDLLRMEGNGRKLQPGQELSSMNSASEDHLASLRGRALQGLPPAGEVPHWGPGP